MLLLLLLATILDSIKDAIDHKKGAQTLYDAWHLVKHINRVVQPLFGAFFVMAAHTSVNIYALLALCLAALWPLSLLWDYIYDNYWPYFVKWDNTAVYRTGWRWLDDRLGFGKQG
jgi:hypothetical protein